MGISSLLFPKPLSCLFRGLSEASLISSPVGDPSRLVEGFNLCLFFGSSSFFTTLRISSLFFVIGSFCFSFHLFQHVLIVCPHKNKKMVKKEVIITWVGIIVVAREWLRGEILTCVVSRGVIISLSLMSRNLADQGLGGDLLVARLGHVVATLSSVSCEPSAHLCYAMLYLGLWIRLWQSLIFAGLMSSNIGKWIWMV